MNKKVIVSFGIKLMQNREMSKKDLESGMSEQHGRSGRLPH